MKFRVTGEFGELAEVRDNVPHSGIDLGMEIGTKLRSISDGVVARTMDLGEKNVGKGIVIRDSHGHEHIYGHLSEVKCHTGEHIKEGQLIALSGNTGNSTGPHLHFGYKVNGEFVNPDLAIKKVSMYAGENNLPDFIAMGTEKQSLWDKFVEHGTVAKDSFDSDFSGWFTDQLIYYGKEIGQIINELSYSTSLITAGVLVILGVMGYEKGFKRAGITVGIFALIRFFLGGL